LYQNKGGTVKSRERELNHGGTEGGAEKEIEIESGRPSHGILSKCRGGERRNRGFSENPGFCLLRNALAPIPFK
jgi:hypothetical protein